MIRREIVMHGGFHVTSEREPVKAGDMVIVWNDEDRAKCVDTGAEVVLVSEFLEFIKPPIDDPVLPSPVDDPVPSPPAEDPAPFADRDFTDSDPEPEVVVVPRAPSPAGSAGDWRDWDPSLNPKGQPMDMTTGTSAKDSMSQQVDGDLLDDTRTPVGSPGPCTQDPNDRSELSSMYY
jgi:hypothetical protein